MESSIEFLLDCLPSALRESSYMRHVSTHAKAMHREEMIKAYQEGFHEELPFIDGDKWYNEKYDCEK